MVVGVRARDRVAREVTQRRLCVEGVVAGGAASDAAGDAEELPGGVRPHAEPRARITAATAAAEAARRAAGELPRARRAGREAGRAGAWRVEPRLDGGGARRRRGHDAPPRAAAGAAARAAPGAARSGARARQPPLLQREPRAAGLVARVLQHQQGLTNVHGRLAQRRLDLRRGPGCGVAAAVPAERRQVRLRQTSAAAARHARARQRRPCPRRVGQAPHLLDLVVHAAKRRRRREAACQHCVARAASLRLELPPASLAQP